MHRNILKFSDIQIRSNRRDSRGRLSLQYADMNIQKNQTAHRLLTVARSSFLIPNLIKTDSPCKPGSVEGNHLSLSCITAGFHNEFLHTCATIAAMTAKPPSTGVNRKGVASDRVYSRRMLPCEWVRSYRTFPPSPRTDIKQALCPAVRLFISVALSRVSPPADVIRYPFPGSPDFPHGKTFRLDTARLPGGVC